MAQAFLEHANITVTDPKEFSKLLCTLFDWEIRWNGVGKLGGETYHVGGRDSYLALYSNGGTLKNGDSYASPSGLNHIGIVVDDLDKIDKRVKSAGYHPHSYDDYEPGKWFYFNGPDDIEIEVVCYT